MSAARCLCLVWLSWVIAAEKSEDVAKVLASLDDVIEEADARKIVGPLLDNLKDLDQEIIDKVVLRQWWGIARDMAKMSHGQNVDLSKQLQKAVKAFRAEADEVLQMLKPGYGTAQQVSPAFQWAQNDTCIFLSIKFTVRWNAPGALEVTDAVVNISDASFYFQANGKHSNNKYIYKLNLDMFDHIVEGPSYWSLASVGKLSATIRKRAARRWPRLLADRRSKDKINNMHVWLEMQQKLDPILSGMNVAAHSPLTCKLSSPKTMLYCSSADNCKKKDDCRSCIGFTKADPKRHICVKDENAEL
eukprot:gnl/TRDRNA2_/TRDRNA2_195594_c0_seq1.p1 gnl/TRDRNA2_/TRDRNA2_195594_c0~~gnl/TRDRNA2_/TRDRNA2_195594_c0_seq1.p1  ORF type:complete len:317 (+),score=73.92 gnl/TRDRNA2_/TRDRNA2_195594_c0_seq1:43-951(+)